MKRTEMGTVALTLALFAALPAGAVTFTAAATTTVSPYVPTSAVFADFNQDGNQDMALSLANGTSHYLRVMLGNGSGGFSSQSDLALPGDPGAATVSGSVVAADVNGDGITDLAVSNPGAGSISIFLGSGDGSFTKIVQDVAVGAMPKAMAVGDFKGGGSRNDLAVVNSGDNTVSILLNDGTGTMTVQGTVSTSPADAISAVAVGDVNGDDIDDIAISRSSAGKATVFRGNGVGTFAPGADISVGTLPVALVAADLDNDGIRDLAVLNSSDATVSIIKGNRSGTLSTGNTLSITNPADPALNPADIIALDLNRDGVPDLAVAGNGNNSVSVLAGKGDATFVPATAAETFATGALPTAIASGDLDGSGNDLLSLSSTNAGYSLLFNRSGEAGGITVTPASHDFGKIQVNSTVMYLSTLLTLANPGSAAVTVDSMALAGGVNSPFQLAPQYGTCGSSTPVIAAGSSCTVEVRFVDPITLGTRTDTLTITSANAANRTALAVPLTGTAVASTTPYNVSISFLGRGNGSVTFSTGDASCSADCSRTPEETGYITLTPAPGSGSYLYGWSGCDSVYNGNCLINFSPSAAYDRTLAVNFGAVLRRIMVAAPTLPTYTTTMADAYASAGQGDTIRMPAGLLDEHLMMNKAIEVTLQGGYDSSFAARGAPTILRSITVAAGTANVDNVVLQ